MNALLRRTAAVVVMGGASLAAAASPGPVAARQEGFTGAWITWWEEGEGISACSRMDVVAESEDVLDGMWATPGPNGVLHGALLRTDAGDVWQGEWRDAEGGTGGFQFELVEPDRFEGTYTVEEGETEAMWSGVRYVEGDIPEAPCVFQG